MEPRSGLRNATIAIGTVETLEQIAKTVGRIEMEWKHDRYEVSVAMRNGNKVFGSSDDFSKAVSFLLKGAETERNRFYDVDPKTGRPTGMDSECPLCALADAACILHRHI